MNWEYRMMKVETHGFAGGKFDAPTVLARLNSFGAEGWELVSAFDTNMHHGKSRDIVFILKRRLAE